MRIITSLLFVLALCLIASPAFAEDGGAASGVGRGLIAIGAGVGLGIAAFGVGMGQGRATAAAMESIGRNPNSADKLFQPFIIGLALMEALALYTFVIAIFLYRQL